MVLTGAFHGTLATLILAGLIFTEETGIPLPMAPGDGLLITAGVLIATGAIHPWVFIPVATVAAIGGGMVGYSWARAVGPRGLRSLAERLHLGRQLDRLERRLQAAGVPGIMFSRLILPGMRVNTTLIAGALEIPRRTFVLALVPSVLVWIGVFTGLGALVGLPLAALLGRIDRALIHGGELLLVGVAGYLAARHVPALRRQDDPIQTVPRWDRVAFAALIDVAIIASVVAGVDRVGRHLLHSGIDDLLDVAIVGVISIAIYFLALRGTFGRTAGEALFGVSYRRVSLEPGGHARRTDHGD